MKVIFLDIEGVLNSQVFVQNNKSEPLDKKECECLKKM